MNGNRSFSYSLKQITLLFLCSCCLFGCINANKIRDPYLYGPKFELDSACILIDLPLELIATVITNTGYDNHGKYITSKIRSIESCCKPAITHDPVDIVPDLLLQIKSFDGNWQSGVLSQTFGIGEMIQPIINNKHFKESSILDLDTATLFYVASPSRIAVSDSVKRFGTGPIQFNRRAYIAILSPTMKSYDEGVKTLWRWHRVAIHESIGSSEVKISAVPDIEKYYISFFKIALFDKYKPSDFKFKKSIGSKKSIEFYSATSNGYYTVRFHRTYPFLFRVSNKKSG